MLEISEKEIKKCVEDLYGITKLGIELYDENKNMLFRYPNRETDFCNILGNTPGIGKNCDRCNVVGFKKCTELRKPYVYRCHMNLTEVFAPIIENDVIIGYITIGHIMRSSDEDKIRKTIIKKTSKLSVDHKALIAAMESLTVVDEKYLLSTIRLISMCACYLYVNKLIRKHVDTIQFQIDEYIRQNLANDLSVIKLCDVFDISRSKLYNISNKTYGIGISDYIRNLRIDTSKELLIDTQYSVKEISERVGFADVNYFIRLFKKKEGITPHIYRKQK